MKKLNKDKIIAQLKKEGLSFSEFSLVHEGGYTTSDADWNYKDVPHLHHIHQLVEAIPTVIADDMIASVNIQKVLGFKLPMCVLNYQSNHNEQTYYTTWLFFVLVVQTTYEELDVCKTRVTTNYNIGCSKLLKWCIPFIRFLIKRNYKDLMSGDIPMRERRGQLRGWGYSFFKNTAYYTFPFTTEILRTNVLPPPHPRQPISISIPQNIPQDGEMLWGRDDHWGLRLVRKQNYLHIFPRMCPHEGASLDAAPCVNLKLKCPWHGRLHSSLASFKLDWQEPQYKTHNNLIFSFVAGKLMVTESEKILTALEV